MTSNQPADKESSLTKHEIKVLLIDDQAIIGESVRRMLAPEDDIQFCHAQDPTKAMHEAEVQSPTVILLDLVMPDIDGMTLLKFFRGNPKIKEIPIIVLSTKEDPKIKAQAFGIGANDYLVKLPDKIELIARIRYHSAGYIHFLQKNEATQRLNQTIVQLKKELNEAADYVKSILPPPLTQGKIKTDWRFIPSASLGGDIFGYHDIDQDHMALYLLDVCGHGVGPALLSVAAHNAVSAQNLSGVDFKCPEQVLSALNSAFPMESHHDMYFTIWYGVYQHSTRTLSYSSGGHPPALLCRSGAQSQILRLGTKCFFIGGMPDTRFHSEQVTINEGDILYIFSDGVYEITRKDHSIWQFEEFMDFIASNNQHSDIIDRLHAYVLDLQNTEILDDDFSMLKVNF